MTRREVIALFGSGAMVWPLVARAQQTLPVIGFLHFASPDGYRPMTAAFLLGLRDSGYAEGENVAIEYRWAEARDDRLPAMAADLVRRQVVVIAATSTPAALAAKAATTTIPIVFETGSDPIMLGLVSNLGRPGSNIPGVSSQSGVLLTQTRLEVLTLLFPNA